ncbi:Fe3+-siderophore ABC transporter permease [Rhodoblastus sphagnicola]|uniref:Fe3+-siderophore ABC transporter permease n=1 Tax=Rhodoblastus sphagnicola TaxID=333368 RepID=A0A2S6MWI4_9HYPH|nr:Fe3+-siderophore ABC transporter permease [Rhodoblastus sphagnicola]
MTTAAPTRDGGARCGAARPRALKTPYRIAALTLALALCALASFMVGRYPVAPATALAILASKIAPVHADWSLQLETIVMNVRLPRIVAALEVGAALAASGAAYQSMFRNPMVSPDILGVSAGAGAGAALAILLAFPPLGVPAMAFGFGLLAVGATCLIGWRSGGDTPLTMILAGVIVGTVFAALIALMKLVADPDNTLPTIVFWLMGSLASVHAADVYFALAPIGVGLLGLVAMSWRLNVLAFGDEEAMTLGIDVGRLRLMVIACATLMTAVAVAIGGLIGLVGLVVPYLGRLVVGSDNRALIPVCAVMGGCYLLLVDDIARSLLSQEIPLGILTSLLGAPVFISLLSHTRKAWA